MGLCPAIETSKLTEERIKEYMEQNNLLGDCDLVAVAGAAKDIASPTTAEDRKFVIRQIDISKSLHHIQKVILMNHTDCGAYGGRKSFASRAEEEKKHFEDMQKAADIITSKYPDLQITKVLANIEDSGEIRFDT